MAGPALTPDEFAREWGAGALVRLPPGPASLRGGARSFLEEAGLPALIRLAGGPSESRLTFCRLAAGLAPVLEEPTVGPPLPEAWSVYSILGDQFFENGSAWWCIDGRTGRIDRIDIELDRPITFAASSAAHLAAAFLTASRWSDGCTRSARAWPAEVERLRRELAALDPAAVEEERAFWPMYLDYIADEGPRCAFRKGSRREGERALRAGAW